MRLAPDSLAAKALVLALVTLILSIPLGMIGSLIAERGNSLRQAGAELAASQAGPQTLAGPFLVVPYVERWTEKSTGRTGEEVRTPQARKSVHIVYPRTLALNGKLEPQERYRGIYKVLFYRLGADVAGTLPAFDSAAIAHTQADSRIELGQPYVAVSLSDIRGVEGQPELRLAGEPRAIAGRVPGMADGSWLGRGFHAPLAGASLDAFTQGRPIAFSLRLAMIGQERLAVVPLAEETTAHLASPWPHPSFGGNFLAVQRNVSDAGFDARWSVSSLASEARAQMTQAARRGGGELAALDVFDVTLRQPINPYVLTDRAVKYGLLFVGLTLMTALMFELLRTLRLHPVQYALVGLSITLFFLLLLALSEKLAFVLAYAIAAGASVLLLTVYFAAVLRGWRRGLSLGGFVGVLYASLYGLLISENNALLLGSLLLFGMLAALMLATRRLDWYALGGAKAHP